MSVSAKSVLVAGVSAWAALQSGRQVVDLPAVTAIPAVERLWLVQIANADDPFPEEFKEAARACGEARLVTDLTAASYFACRAKYVKSARYRIAQVHAAPDERSAVLATLFEERRVPPSHQLEYVWTFELASQPGTPVPWPESWAAFDYGLNVAGAHRRGDWVRLLSATPVDGWFRVAPEGQAASVYVWATPLLGQLVDLSVPLATWPDGRPRPTGGGPYLVTNVSANGSIEFRAEIPSDMPCVEPVTDPVALPPTLRSTAEQFFNADGAPRFRTSYPQGC